MAIPTLHAHAYTIALSQGCIHTPPSGSQCIVYRLKWHRPSDKTLAFFENEVFFSELAGLWMLLCTLPSLPLHYPSLSPSPFLLFREVRVPEGPQRTWRNRRKGEGEREGDR